MFFLQEMLTNAGDIVCGYFLNPGDIICSLYTIKARLVFLEDQQKMSKKQSKDFIDVNKKTDVNLVVSCCDCDWRYWCIGFYMLNEKN